MMTIELDPSKVSAQTHTFIGMFREPWGAAYWRMREMHPIGFPKGIMLHDWDCQGTEMCRQAWLLGELDIPQYRVIEEAVGPEWKFSEAQRERILRFIDGIPESPKDSIAAIIEYASNCAEITPHHHVECRKVLLAIRDRLAALEKGST
jgi:hypothetical protein